jgi:hypothetical protein
MGVKFDRILDGFDGPFEPVTALLDPPTGTVTAAAHPAGYVVSHRYNNSFILMNRLFKAQCEVYWFKSAPGELANKDLGTGALWIPASASSRAIVEKASKDLGIDAYGVAKRPAGADLKLKPIRVALYDQYGGLMPSGWTRWLFEQYEFPFKVLYPQNLDAGELKNFDVLVFTDGAIRAPGSGGRGEGFAARQPKPEDIPAEYRGWLGRITTEKTIPQIKAFVEAGGTVVTIGSSTSLAGYLNLPISNALTERTKDAKETPLPPEKFYIPGSLLTVNVDNTNPLAYGMPDKVDVFFDNSPSFKLNPDAGMKGTSTVAWYPTETPLHSGWAWGQQYLKDTVAVAEASLGSGKIFLLAPEVAFRGQPAATFKFIFNGIYYGPALNEQRKTVAVSSARREEPTISLLSRGGQPRPLR